VFRSPVHSFVASTLRVPSAGPHGYVAGTLRLSRQATIRVSDHESTKVRKRERESLRTQELITIRSFRKARGSYEGEPAAFFERRRPQSGKNESTSFPFVFSYFRTFALS
jgi:hypothetical protein